VTVPDDDSDPGGGRRLLATTRLEAFSDGVFAIAITLLVLDLGVGSEGSAWARVVDGWPSYLAYFVSFLTIGAAWLAHTGITRRLAGADLELLRINLLLLLVVGLLPFPTGLVAKSIEDVNGERVFVALYGLVLLAVRLMLTAMDGYARRHGLYHTEGGVARGATPGVVPVVVAYGVTIAVGVLLPVVAVGFYCAIAVALVVPIGEVRRLLQRGG
jgi:uncharacterized membrane protein